MEVSKSALTRIDVDLVVPAACGAFTYPRLVNDVIMVFDDMDSRSVPGLEGPSMSFSRTRMIFAWACQAQPFYVKSH